LATTHTWIADPIHRAPVRTQTPCRYAAIPRHPMVESIEACRLCGSTRAVITREHIPPKSTGNRGAHQVYTTRFGPGLTGKIELSDGFALRVLCDRCNSRFGSRLGTTFGSFVQQIQQSGRFVSPRGGVYACAMDVYPSRIYRQLLLNFLCVQSHYGADHWKDVREYVKSRHEGLPPDTPRIGLYYNISESYRVVPIGGITCQVPGAWRD
jgi:hypothetical protein